MLFGKHRRANGFENGRARGGVWRRLSREIQYLAHEWREDRDTLAIKRALSKLSDRRLHLIGLRRRTLEQDIRRMMWDIQAGRTIEAEVLQILDEADRRDTSADVLMLPKPGSKTRPGAVIQFDAARS
ncbi:hypothetical protein [Tateyamaria sp. ANG-S1]|uniref:hypothetical protein n=1 Tax=Tateyamaria sp. ANG-S1 TaxID=1577905 RepID=UPI00057EEE38|nr:hypothetical protein [Tateyamaria sp. ANG-S1]KIC48038.1 hypothetical protein RA29_17745 [Tateyamaria sp. ANG-S1]